MWQKMSADELAAFERSQGEEIMQVNGVYWQRIRRFFYRPLLPFREYPASSQSFPPRAPFRGYQCAVPAHEPANSRLNVLLFTDPKSYTLESLERAKRKQVRASAKEFTIRRLEEVKEFSDKAHPVYLSFYERTRYGYKAERRDPRVFARWAESVYRFPQNLVLGAFKDTELHAVSISRLVEDTLVYSMVFCTELALRLNVTSALLHHLREAAAASPDIKQMFVGMYKYHRWDFSANWIFATGRPYTAPSGAYSITLLDGTSQDFFTVTSKNHLRLPDYHRFDVAATYKLLMGNRGDKKRRELGAINFSIFNLYNHQNIWYKQFTIVEGKIIETNVNYLGIVPNVTLSLKFR